MRIIIFDFDGTIADSFGVLLEIFENTMNREQKLTSREVEQLRSKSIREIIKYLKIKKWQIPKLLLRAKRAIALKITDIKPFDDMPKVLKQLHAEGAQMFILSTNSAANISKFLVANNLDGCFTKIYGDTALRSKASALKKLVKKEGLAKDNCVYVGDEVRDVDGGQKAGIPVVAVVWGFNHADALKRAKPSALATTPLDLLAILEAL